MTTTVYYFHELSWEDEVQGRFRRLRRALCGRWISRQEEAYTIGSFPAVTCSDCIRARTELDANKEF